MGVFTSEAKAVKAAFDMTEALDANNAQRDDRAELRLKIGLHRGPVIVVTLNNRLDYFGRTVNIASRVESASKPRELCMTDGVFDGPGVRDILRTRVSKVRRGPMTFKGIDTPVTVYHVGIPARVQAPQGA